MNTIIKNVHIHPITSPSINNGDVHVMDGKIYDFGEKIEIPKQAEYIDGKGLDLYPGLIDVHTHLGLYDEGTGWAGSDANETIEATTPHLRAIDGAHPLDPAFFSARKAGVTTAHIMPGSANIIGGTTSVIKTAGHTINQMILRQTAGLKIALGENPKRIHSQSKNASITRLGIMGTLRETFYAAMKETEPNLRVKPIHQALNKEIPVRIHAHRADDIITALRFADEFDLDLRIEHCTEGHLIADELAGRNLQVSVGPTFTRASKIELRNKTWQTYKILHDFGIRVSITTDHPYTPIQYLNICAALAAREGLRIEDALRGITIIPAKNLGIDNRVGSIEKGKDADLVLWSGHPFEYLSKPVWTMIDGKMVYYQE
ncbi:Imidazolonepropionase [Halobacillus karajensis]|uniref:Imidazolonepropionase n=1 Tax=Halobacillus karajensis TaxID=195088 RepID=A0A024P537_9BACI|nr:amidohydrolase [Halobacillus karajensis]CDQ20387.1 imidazolonepropionase [Halobacillus karajensis]CDQ24144.1 imidazolonepropionase [Halobacillus karajensis]CDQ27622.1 imidazolonepropionase [Halobacillus karajensis]SEH92406.1 Imidazolonepropionase [Halobacillus karajensis]